MRVLVCGGRRFNRHSFIYHVLDSIHDETPITHIIAGGATGADKWAESWAWMMKDSGVSFVCYPAGWATYGRAAGPKRNQQMIDDGKPDLVVAFPGGAGTADMVRRARRAKIKVREEIP